MKKTLTISTVLLTLMIVGCSKKSDTAEKTTMESEKTTLPESCEAYFTTIEKFIKDYPAMADAYKQQLDQAREQWAKVTDQKQLDKTCEQANNQLKQALDSIPKQ